MTMRGNKDYVLLRDMEQNEGNVTWKKFFVIVAGRTNGAHKDIIDKLRRVGQTEVNSVQQCDYVLLICPISSRVGTDIDEALEAMPGGKPAIMVVMHHTFNRDIVLADSRRQVSNPNIRLTLDVLFHEGVYLNCSRNDDAWNNIERFLNVRTNLAPSWGAAPKDGNGWPWKKIICGAIVGVVLIIVVSLAVKLGK